MTPLLIFWKFLVIAIYVTHHSQVLTFPFYCYTYHFIELAGLHVAYDYSPSKYIL